MKNIAALLTAALLAALTLSACVDNNQLTETTAAEITISAVSSAEQESEYEKPVYTNLVGEAVRDEVGEILISAGISREYVEKVFEWVEDFNECMSGCETFELADGFTLMDSAAINYGDYYPRSVMWYKTNKRDYGDILCRIAAFWLIRDNIAVEKPLEKERWECYNDAQWLYSDYATIHSNPLVDFDGELESKYFSLFAPVEADESSTAEEIYKNIQKEWERRGITFSEGKASLITIWTQYENQAAAAHAAVLAEYGEGLLLFEKTNPQSPYQATKFSSLEQIRRYMLESVDDEAGECVVMKNDKII